MLTLLIHVHLGEPGDLNIQTSSERQEQENQPITVQAEIHPTAPGPSSQPKGNSVCIFLKG